MPRSAVARRCRTTAYVGRRCWPRAPWRAAVAAARRPAARPRPRRGTRRPRRGARSRPADGRPLRRRPARITAVRAAASRAAPARRSPAALVRIRGREPRAHRRGRVPRRRRATPTTPRSRRARCSALAGRARAAHRGQRPGRARARRRHALAPRPAGRWRSWRAASRRPPAGMIDAEVQAHKVFFGARRPAELSYVVGGTRAGHRAGRAGRAPPTARSCAVGRRRRSRPASRRPCSWDGTVDGEVAPAGLYEFRVHATAASGIQATSSAATGPAAEAPGGFTFLRYRFPIVGGTATARAARGSAAAAAIRARTSSPPAARRSSRRAAAR